MPSPARDPQSAVSVRASDRHGRGVFARRAVANHALLDRSPVLLLSAADGRTVMRTMLREYIFEVDGSYALACGPVTFCNHSYAPNAEYEVDLETQTLELRALRPIAAGEEILINYNGDPSDDSPLWFAPAQV